MTEFDGLTNLKDWSEKLLGILDEAAALEADASTEVRVSFSRRLRAFMTTSPPLEGMEELDEIAAKAARDVLDAGIESRLSSIATRTAELKRVGRRVSDRASELERNASALRLEKVATVIHSMTDSVAALQELSTHLERIEGNETAPKVREAIAALLEARRKVESLT